MSEPTPADAEIVAAEAVIPSVPAAPTGASERILLLDCLRGFAVLGILLVNITMYAHPLEARMLGGRMVNSSLDAFAVGFVRMFAEGKFYPLFSLLFGLGFALQVERATRDHRSVTRLYVRRLLVLGLFGLVHGLLIWFGDILFLYAIVGFLLLALHKVRSTILGWIAALCLVVPGICCGGGMALFFGAMPKMMERARAEARPGAPEIPDMMAEFTKRVDHAYAAYPGGFGDIALQRLQDWTSLQSQSIVTIPTILAMFLFGLLIGRRRIAAAPGEHQKLLKRFLVVGLVVGLPLNALYAWILGSSTGLSAAMGLAMGLVFLAGPLLMFGYASAAALAAIPTGAPRLLRPLAPVGRMALTNYLSHSVLMTLLFYGYGFGLYGRIGAAGCLGIALGLYAVQILWSHAWLRRFHYGPVEWLWRWWTYGKKPRLSRGPA